MKILFLSLLAISSFTGFAQESTPGDEHQLQIGDKVPAVLLKRFINYNKTTEKLSSFYKDRLLILDFWSTNCASCIEAFPKIEKLQQEFSGKIQILLVTYQPPEMIERFLHKRKQLVGEATGLPIVCGDTVLKNLFKPPAFPHYVWIDKNGIVKQITYSWSVTRENISAVLNNEPLTMEVKNDKAIQIDEKAPLFINGNAGDGKQLLRYSVLSKHIEGVPSMQGIFDIRQGEQSMISAYNYPIKSLYQVAYNDRYDRYGQNAISENRTVLDVSDSSGYVWQSEDGAILWQNLYCYQRIVPKTTHEELQKLMQEDLRTYFDLEARIEKRKVRCLVLTAEDTSLIRTKGGVPMFRFDPVNYTLTVQNVSDSELVQNFTLLLSGFSYPFIDETNVKGNVDFVLHDLVLTDISSIRRSLKKYRMNLKLEDREVNILLITDRKQNLSTGVSNGRRKDNRLAIQKPYY